MALNWKRAKTNTYRAPSDFDEISRRRDMEATRILMKDDQRKKDKWRGPKSKKGKNAINKTKQPSLKPGHLTIYTDGACEPNPGCGGWAFVVYRNGKEVHHDNGGVRHTTNNVMEMTGILRALQWLLENGEEAVIFSDSQYAVKGCTIWRRGWKTNGWKRSNGEDLANVALWQEIDSLLSTVRTRILWVKGHDGLEGNERADALSVEGREMVKRPHEPERRLVEQLRYSI